MNIQEYVDQIVLMFDTVKTENKELKDKITELTKTVALKEDQIRRLQTVFQEAAAQATTEAAEIQAEVIEEDPTVTFVDKATKTEYLEAPLSSFNELYADKYELFTGELPDEYLAEDESDEEVENSDETTETE